MVSKRTNGGVTVTLTEAGRLALDLDMVLEDIETELSALTTAATGRGLGVVDLDDLGRLWLLVRRGRILTHSDAE